MGFLLGAYGKLAAGSRYRSIQARLMRIQSRMRRVTREVSTVEKMIKKQETTGSSVLSSYSSMMKAQYQQGMYAGIQNDATYKSAQQTLQTEQAKGSSADSNVISAANSQINQIQTMYQTQMQVQMSNLESQVAMKKLDVDNYTESLRDTVLEPLKDEEEELQSEKDSLESEMEIAKNDYEACKKMEQNDAKMLAPSYTASGQ